MISIDISNKETQDLLDYVENNIADFSAFEISIVFKADYNQARIIRNLISYLFDKNGIDSLWKNRFSLIGDELINNSIEYGSLPLDKNTFTIKLEKRGSKFYVGIQVEDTGKGLFAKKAMEMEQLKIQKETEGFQKYLGKRGRGLFQLITSMVDSLYFKDSASGGLIVGIEKILG